MIQNNIQNKHTFHHLPPISIKYFTYISERVFKYKLYN
jgi:hypothetical protein